MTRRKFLRNSAFGSAALLAARAVRGLTIPIIKDIRVIATAPAGLRLSIVKIVTDQDGLYGYGCANFTQRAELVNAAVDWQACYSSSYWRNGPVLNNAGGPANQAACNLTLGWKWRVGDSLGQLQRTPKSIGPNRLPRSEFEPPAPETLVVLSAMQYGTNPSAI